MSELSTKVSGTSSVMTAWEEKLEVVKSMLDPERKLSVPQFEAFCYQAKKTGLDPLARQIYFTMNQGKLSVQSTIDGFRLISERSGKYRGMRGPWWCGADGVWKDVWLSSNPPAAAKVEILRSDFDDPISAVATWAQYCPLKDGSPIFMWKKMGPLMLGKCAEALARRIAFPQELSGLYAQEEMEQADPKAAEERQAKAEAKKDAKAQEEAGEEDQRPKAERKAQPAPEPKAATVIDEKPREPEKAKADPMSFVSGFKNDCAKASTRAALNSLWEEFSKAVAGNQQALDAGWKIKKENSQRLVGGVQ